MIVSTKGSKYKIPKARQARSEVVLKIIQGLGD